MQNQLLKDRRLYVIFGITLVGVMGVASITPALPKIAKTLALTQTQIGLMISAFTFPGIFLTPIAGIIADRIGRKKVLVPGLLLFGIAGFGIFFVEKFEYIILLRILQGIGAAPIGSLNTTLIGDFYKGKQRPEVMGYNASVLSLSTASYPLIGGFLAAIAWNFPFILPLLAIPIGLLVIWGIEEPKIEKPASFTQYLKDISKSIARKEVFGVFVLGIITFIILYGAFLTYIPFLLNERFSFDSGYIGMVLSLSSITTAILATQVGRLTSRFGSIKLLRMAFFLYFLVTMLIPFIYNIWLFLIPILLFGSAQALNIPSLQTAIANLAPDNQRGAFMSLNGMMLRIGQTIGPLIIGIGYIFKGIMGAYFLAALVALLGVLILFTTIKQKHI